MVDISLELKVFRLEASTRIYPGITTQEYKLAALDDYGVPGFDYQAFFTATNTDLEDS